jgi:hypothetical protein
MMLIGSVMVAQQQTDCTQAVKASALVLPSIAQII